LFSGLSEKSGRLEEQADTRMKSAIMGKNCFIFLKFMNISG
jgi:hypothetical protein